MTNATEEKSVAKEEDLETFIVAAFNNEYSHEINIFDLNGFLVYKFANEGPIRSIYVKGDMIFLYNNSPIKKFSPVKDKNSEVVNWKRAQEKYDDACYAVIMPKLGCIQFGNPIDSLKWKSDSLGFFSRKIFNLPTKDFEQILSGDISDEEFRLAKDKLHEGCDIHKTKMDFLKYFQEDPENSLNIFCKKDGDNIIASNGYIIAHIDKNHDSKFVFNPFMDIVETSTILPEIDKIALLTSHRICLTPIKFNELIKPDDCSRIFINRWGMIEDFKTFKYPMSDLSVGILGIGDNSATKHNNASFIISADKKYLVDCPPRINAILSKTSIKPTDLNDIIITHNHDDHIGGLGAFLIQHLKLNNNKIKLYTTSKIYNDLINQFYGGGIYKNIFRDKVEFVELKVGEKFERDGITIEIRDNLHVADTPTIGFKFSYKGKTLGYSSDCKYPGESYITELAKSFEKNGADLDIKDIICFANSEMTRLGGSDPEEDYNIEPFVKNEIIHRLSQITGMYKDWFEKSSEELANKFPDYDIFSEPEYKFEEHILKYKNSLVVAFKEFLSKQSINWFSECNTLMHEATNDRNDPVHTYFDNLIKRSDTSDNLQNRMYVCDVDKIPVAKPEIATVKSKKLVYIHVPDNFHGGQDTLEEFVRYNV